MLHHELTAVASRCGIQHSAPCRFLFLPVPEGPMNSRLTGLQTDSFPATTVGHCLCRPPQLVSCALRSCLCFFFNCRCISKGVLRCRARRHSSVSAHVCSQRTRVLWFTARPSNSSTQCVKSDCLCFLVAYLFRLCLGMEAPLPFRPTPVCQLQTPLTPPLSTVTATQRSRSAVYDVCVPSRQCQPGTDGATAIGQL